MPFILLNCQATVLKKHLLLTHSFVTNYSHTRRVVSVSRMVVLLRIQDLKPAWRLLARSHSREKHLLALSCPSACINATSTERISVKFDTGDLYEILSRKSKFGTNRSIISGTLTLKLPKSALVEWNAIKLLGYSRGYKTLLEGTRM